MAEENIQILKLNLEADGGQSVSELLQLIEQLKTKLVGLKDGTSDYASVANTLKSINKELGESFSDMGTDMSKASEDVKKLVDALTDVVGVYHSLGNVDLNPDVVSQLTEISNAITTLSEVGAIEDVSEDMVEFSSNVDMTNLTVGELVERITDLTGELVETDTVTEDTVEQVVELIDAYKELGQRIEETDETVQGNVRSYRELTLEMKELKKIWRETNDEAERTRIGARILELNNELKALDATIGNYQRNVGNYSSAMTDFSKVILSNLGQIDPSLKKVGLQIKSLIPLIKTATTTATAGLTGIKAAIAGTGIGLLVIAVGELIANFDKLKTKVKDSIPYFKTMKEELEGIKDNAEKLSKSVASDYSKAQEEITQKLAIEAAKRKGISSKEKKEQMQELKEELALQEKLRDEQAKAHNEQVDRRKELTRQLNELIEKSNKVNVFPSIILGATEKKILKDAIEVTRAELEGVYKVIDSYKDNLKESEKIIEGIGKKIEVLNNKPLKETSDTVSEIKNKLKDESDFVKLIHDWGEMYRNAVVGFLSESQQLYHTNEKQLRELELLLDRISSTTKIDHKWKKDNLATYFMELNLVKFLLNRQEMQIKNEEKIKNINKEIQLLELNRPKDSAKYIDDQIKSYSKLLEVYKQSLTEEEKFTKILLNPFESIYDIGKSLKIDVKEAIKQFNQDFKVNLKVDQSNLIELINYNLISAFKNGETIDLTKYFGEGIAEHLFPKDDLVEIETKIKETENLIEDLGYNLKTLDLTRPLRDLEYAMQENLLDNFNKFNDGYKKMLDDRVDAQRDYIKKVIEIGAAPDETMEQFTERLKEQHLKLKEFMKDQQDWIDENRNYWIKYSMSIADAFGSMLGTIADDWYDMIQVQLRAGEISQEEYNRQFEKMKGLQIAEATVQMITGAIGAFMQASLAYPPPYGQILGGITAAAVTASGLAEIAKIRRTTMDNVGRQGWSTTAPTIANPVIQEYTPDYSQNVTGRDEITTLANALSENPLRAFVVESDITSAQQLSRKRNEEATF